MYFPFRDEEEVKYNNSYSNKLKWLSAVEFVTSNHSKVEPYATIVKDAFERLIVDHANIDPFWQQENNEVYDQLNSALLAQMLKPN